MTHMVYHLHTDHDESPSMVVLVDSNIHSELAELLDHISHCSHDCASGEHSYKQ